MTQATRPQRKHARNSRLNLGCGFFRRAEEAVLAEALAVGVVAGAADREDVFCDVVSACTARHDGYILAGELKGGAHRVSACMRPGAKGGRA